MMPRIYLFLLLGVLSLRAQTAVNDEDKLHPANPPEIAPANPPGAVILQPGVNAPPPGAAPVLPMIPAAPPVYPKITEFHVTPGTVREGINYGDELLTTIVLSAPAIRDTVIHIVSSDPAKVECGDITLIKGHQMGTGGIKVSWKNIKHDGQVKFKASDDKDPDIVFLGRLYFYKKPQ
jgi:hypothetical protein